MLEEVIGVGCKENEERQKGNLWVDWVRLF
jgi:hypothetical protein